MRERLLVRHFLWRFLENDLVSPNADRRGTLSAVGGTLAAVSLFMAVLVAWFYQSSPTMPPGFTALFSLDNRFLFISSSMLVMALAAVAQWDALVLDARDAAVLGVLPISRAVIVRTKFAATALFAAAVVVAWNLFPTLLRFAAVPISLRIGIAGSAQLTVAQGVVAVAAGVFGFLAVLGLREIVFAIVGPARFRKISAALQALLIVMLTTALLLVPGVSGVARQWRSDGRAARVLPPSWFVGLHETLAGSVIDDVPRSRPERTSRPNAVTSGRLLRQVEATRRREAEERDATDLYRALWPLYHELAAVGVGAWCLIALITAAACLWNSRRLPTEAHRPVSKSGTVRLVCRWVVVHAIARTPLSQAGFFFTLQTLSRRVTHRVALATAWAVGLALVVIAAGGGRLAALSDRESIPVAILAAQSLLLGCVLNGFRHATRVPSELRATTTFSLAWAGHAAPFIAGVKRAGWIAVAGPALLGLAIWHIAILGPRLAGLHLGVGAGLSVLVIEMMFLRERRVPFVNGFASSVDVKVRIAGFFVALLSVSFTVAWVERWSFNSATRYWAFVATLLGLSFVLAALDRVSSASSPALECDEDPLPTQRLNLAQ
jgi:hypothetical protein